MAGEGPAPPAESAFGSEGSGVEGEAGEVSVEKARLEEGEGLGGVVPGPGRRRMTFRSRVFCTRQEGKKRVRLGRLERRLKSDKTH